MEAYSNFEAAFTPKATERVVFIMLCPFYNEVVCL